MWEQLQERLFEKLVIICTISAFLIPYLMFKANEKFRKYSDPPWIKKDDVEKR